MERTLSAATATVSLSGPRITQHTVEAAIKGARLDNVEVTWRARRDDDDDEWRITVATGHRVAVGALPPGRQTADHLAALLRGLFGG